MAKAGLKKGQVIKCEVCGETFSGGRAKGEHIKNSPKCQTAEWKAKQAAKQAAKQGEKKGKAAVAGMSADSYLKAAIDAIAGELAIKRQALADVDKLKAEITELDNRRQALVKLLPKETPV